MSRLNLQSPIRLLQRMLRIVIGRKGLQDRHPSGPADFVQAALTDSIEQFFRTLGWTVYRDKPYKGTYVPLKFYSQDRRVSSIMIEVNRKLYMDEETGEKRMSFPEIQRIVAGLVSQWIRLPFSS